MSATAFQRMRREAEAKAKASQKQVEEINTEIAEQAKNLEKAAQQEQQEAEHSEDGINLDDMSVEELTQYANEHCIDIGNASSQKGILKKIKEAE